MEEPWQNYTNCCVPHCNSLKKKHIHLSFFAFPAPERSVTVVDASGNELTINIRQEWISKLNIKGEVTPHMRVCSLHFANDDFLPNKVETVVRRHIKCYAIPSRNLPTEMKSEKFPSIYKCLMEGNRPWENYRNCCVPHCHSIKKKNVSFFKFPAPERLVTAVDPSGNESIINVRQEWISKLNIRGEISPNMRVCNLHFANTDFLPSKDTLIRRDIKCYAIPSRNLPTDMKSEKLTTSSILFNVLQSSPQAPPPAPPRAPPPSCKIPDRKCYSGPASTPKRSNGSNSRKECFPPIKLKRCSYDFATGALYNTEKLTENDIKPKLEKIEVTETKPVIKEEAEEKNTNRTEQFLITSRVDLSKKCYLGPATKPKAKQFQQALADELKPLSVLRMEPCEYDFAPETMVPINQMYNKSSEELIERVQGTENLRPAVDMLDAVSSTGEKIQIEVYKIQ